MSDGQEDFTHLTRRRTVWLVARRELLTRMKSKAFLVSTGLTVAAVVLTSVLFQTFNKEDGPQRIAVSGGGQQLETSIATTAEAVGRKVNVQPAFDVASARQAVLDSQLDALVIDNGDRLQVVVKSSLNEQLENALKFAAERAALDRQITALGGDPVAVTQTVSAAGVDVEKLTPPREYNNERLALGSIAGILIYLILLITGQMVAQGVVEEKSSRIVEVLLATIRPGELMTGKVLGIGIAGLLQVFLIGVAGVGSGLITGALSISVSAAGGALVWFIVWFVLGFSLFSLGFAASAALVSRQEDVNSVTTPIMSFLIIGYFVGIVVLPNDPSNRVAEVLSLIPVFAPTLMPMRLAMGGVPAWQAAFSALLALACIPALMWLAGRIYQRAIVRTGGRVKLAEVLR